jgi:hypothetical protein
LLFVAASAQEQKEAAPDTVRKFQWPTGLRVGTDLIAIGKTVFGSPLESWEVNADVDFGRYYLAVDYGNWSRTETLRNGDYKNEGNYWRAGVDINFLTKDPDKNMFFIGFRYARAAYDEYMNYNFTTPEFGDQQRALSNISATGSWGEMTLGLRVKIWKEIWMGYTARMKFLPSTNVTGELDTYDLPGYGIASDNLYWGFNYQVFYRIPFKSQKETINLDKNKR